MVQHGKVEELRPAQGNQWRWSDNRTLKQQHGYRTHMYGGWVSHQKDLERLFGNFTDDFVDTIFEGHFALVKQAMARGWKQLLDERTLLHCARAIPHTIAYDNQGRMLYMDFWLADKLVTT
jgi:hypothetical protein